MFQLTPVVKNLLIINIAFFVGAMAVGDQFYEWFSLFYPKSELFQPWQVVTHFLCTEV